MSALTDPFSGREWSVEEAAQQVETAGLTRREIAQAKEGLERQLLPCDRNWLGDRLTMLWTMFMASRTSADPAMLAIWLQEHLRLLGDLPQDIAEQAIDGAIQTACHGFLPSIGEIRAIAQPLLTERAAHVARLGAIVKTLGPQ